MIARTDEPVTVGIPLPDRYPDASTLAITGATAAQFKVLGRYPSGNVKWVLCDFQASVGAGGTTTTALTSGGAGTFGGADLATDNGATISIATGAATFRIRKANCNVFDNVLVGATTLVSAQTGEIVLWDQTDTKYSSRNDASSTATIEENGPLRCLIKCTGAFKSAGGVRLCDYTLRMNFYKGKSFVRATLTLRNEDTATIRPVYFHALETIVPLAIANNLTATLAKKVGTATATLTTGQRATLFQAFSLDKCEPSRVHTGFGGWDPPLPGSGNPYVYTSNGLEIIAGGVTLNAPGNENDWTQGYADLRNASGVGCTVALRWMSAHWPAGFDLGADGTLSIESYSKRNGKVDNKLKFCKHDNRQILWDFHASANDPLLSLARLEVPLLARAPWQHYMDTGALYGQNEFVSPAEQNTIFTALGHTDAWPIANFNAGPPMLTYRWWYWPDGGGTNQTDEALGSVHEFLRGGPNVFFWRGYARALFNTTAPWHVLPGQESVAYDPGQNDANFWTGSGISGDFYDAGHFHCQVMPFAYYVTGEPMFAEEVDAIRRFYWRVHIGKGGNADGTSSPGNTNWESYRPWCRTYRNLAICYEFGQETGRWNDTRLTNILRLMTDQVLDARDDPALGRNSPPGRNLVRGYLYDGWDGVQTHPTWIARPDQSLMSVQIGFEAFWRVREMRRHQGIAYRDEETEDFLEGWARYILDEYLDDQSFPTSDVVSYKGFLYMYLLDYQYPPNILTSYTTWPDPWPLYYNLELWPYDCSRAALFAYYKSGNNAHLTRALQILWRNNLFANWLNSSELQGQALLAATLRPPPCWRDLTVNVTPSGSDYILSWSPPAGVVRYQIKASPKTIVPWLGFNRTTRAYQYDPASYAPYFAATTLSAPAPPANSTTISGQPAGQHFAMRYFK